MIEISNLLDVEKFEEVIIEFDPKASVSDVRTDELDFFDSENFFIILKQKIFMRNLPNFFDCFLIGIWIFQTYSVQHKESKVNQAEYATPKEERLHQLKEKH